MPSRRLLSETLEERLIHVIEERDKYRAALTAIELETRGSYVDYYAIRELLADTLTEDES